MASFPSPTSSPSTGGSGQNSGYRSLFSIMTSLFFLWGFMTGFNDILIPRFKEAFTLSYFQAMLVQFAFFGAYFVGSLIYSLVSITTGDPIAKLGYKNGVVIGLLISATGAGLFWPAANHASYPMFLAGLFVVGFGFAMLQIAANPYVTILGPEKTSSSRLNLAQGFNSIGTTIGPIIGGFLIYQCFAETGAHGADSVKLPYLMFSIVFVALALIFFFIQLPHVGEGKIERGAGALKYPHVVLGVIGIFMYVVIPLLAYLLLWAAKSCPMDALQGKSLGEIFTLWGESFRANWSVFKLYLPFIWLCWLLFRFGKGLAGRTLTIFSLTVVALLLTAILVGGKLAMCCVVAVGLFTSIGWSNTFSLALEGTGVLKSQVSSLLVMAILGGAILPPLQGWIADYSNIQFFFIVPLIAYAYVAFYGAGGHRIGRNKLANESAA